MSLGLRPIAVALAGACAALGLLLVVASALVVGWGGGPTPPTYSAAAAPAPATTSVGDIPDAYMRLYVAAAQRYGLNWAVLAGIGKVECDHGRDPAPSCTQEGAVNSAGAGGPAQFLESTWLRYGVDADGDGVADRWDPADAIFSMANYLRASGAPGDYAQAIYAYNHAWWYVAEVEHWAAVYRADAAAASSSAVAPPPLTSAAPSASSAAPSSSSAAPSSSSAAPSPASAAPSPTSDLSPSAGSGSVLYVAGSRPVLQPGDGHVALVPLDAPPAVQAMIEAGNDLQDLPYGFAGHPDPVGAPSEDCSSTVSYVLYRGGVRSLAEIVRDNPVAQSYVDWGLPGPGRWVTIYATAWPIAHVFIVVDGLRLDTSHHGTDIGPNRDQDGPRWRILPYIPTWAHWAVRHPPGL